MLPDQHMKNSFGVPCVLFKVRRIGTQIFGQTVCIKVSQAGHT